MTTFTRRDLARLALILPAGLVPAMPLCRTLAQTTPAIATFGDGLPRLDLTVTATAIEGMPEEVTAGRYLVTVSVREDVGSAGGGLLFARPGSGDTEAFLPLVSPSPATLSDEEYATQYYGGTYPGGLYTSAGNQARMVIDLEPGRWVLAGGFQNPQSPVVFLVTGDMPSNLREPVSDATITMSEYAFDLSAGALQPGSQVIRVRNIGNDPHHIYVGRSTVPVTEADIEAVLQAGMTGTPAPVSFNPDEDLLAVFSVAEVSSDMTMWIEASFEPGVYLLACFIPAREDSLSHALHGMYRLVDIQA